MRLRILILLLAAAGTMVAQTPPEPALEAEVSRLIHVFATAEAEAADPVSLESAFYQGAIPGMLRTLDPHSVFFDPGQFQQLQEMERSEQKGFGTIVSVVPGRVIVLQALPGTPSAKAGLAAGDEILAVNGYVIAMLEPEQLIQLLGEARQREAALDVRRAGAASLLRFTLTPELVKKPSVDRAFMIAPEVGYLRITAFEEETGKLVRDMVAQLGGEVLKGLIVDLRGNPGGDVKSAVEVASLFLQPEQLIFSVKGRNAKGEEARVPRLAKPYRFPMAVLVDDRSASASEIVSGSLQDHDRAVILGEPTFGKGLVQQVFPLSANTGLALTTAFYYTPSGRSIQKPLRDGQLGAATVVEQGPYKTDQGRTVRGGGGIQPDEEVHPAPLTRLRAALDATGLVTSFASEVLRSREIAEEFEVSPTLLDEFRVYLSGRKIQPGLGEWLADRDWIQSRLKEEMMTLKFGVDKGEQVEMRRDPVVIRALKRLAP